MTCLKTSAVLVLAALLAFPALAQEGTPAPPPDSVDDAAVPESGTEAWEKVRIGLKAGATWSNLRGEFAFDDIGSVPFEGDFGFALGASVEIPIGTRWSVQPAAFLVRKFSAIRLDNADVVEGHKLSVNYIELPVLLKWYPGNRAGIQGNVVLGPMPSLRLAATRELRRGEFVIDEDASDIVNSLDWALVVGGGFEFDELLGAFTVDFRFTHGFRDIAATPSASAARWSVLQMVVGITL